MNRLARSTEVAFTELPNLFSNLNNDVVLVDDIRDFLEANLLNTLRNLGVDKEGKIAIVHFVSDRSALEQFASGTIDDATCEIVLDKFKDDEKYKQVIYSKLEELEKDKNLKFKLLDYQLKYGDGVFHTILTCTLN
jgi:hypothetical protein